MDTINIVVGTDVHQFVIERSLLATSSEYFKRLLDGSFNDVVDNTIFYPDITKEAFEDFIISLKCPEYQSKDIKHALTLFELRRRFAVTTDTLVVFITKLPRLPLSELVPALTKIITEFDEEVINALARHYRHNDDLSTFDETFVTAIKASPNCRYYGEGTACELVCKLEQLVDTEPKIKKQYIIIDAYSDNVPLKKIFTAVNLPDLVLQLRDWFHSCECDNIVKHNTAINPVNVMTVIKAEQRAVNCHMHKITDTIHMTDRGKLRKNGEYYQFPGTPYGRLYYIFTPNGVVAAIKGVVNVVGRYVKVPESRSFLITHLCDDYLRLEKVQLSSFNHEDDWFDTSKIEHQETSDFNPELNDIFHFFTEQMRDNNISVNDIFSHNIPVNQIMADLVGGYVIYEI